MKQLVANYTFDKNTRTVTFTDFTSGIDIERIFLITNITRGKIVYQFNSAGLGGSVAGNILTLTADTTAMSNSDKLQIIYDYEFIAPGEDIQTNSLFIRSLRDEFSGTASSNNSDLVPSTDVSPYKWGSLQLSGAWVATVQVQGSNDNSTWTAIAVNNIGAANQQFSTALTAAGMYAFPVSFRYMRIRTTTFSSGPVAGTLEMYSMPTFPSSLGVAITQQGTLAVGGQTATGVAVPANAMYMGMLGQDGNLIGLRSAEVDNVTVGSLRSNPYLFDGIKSDRQRTLRVIKNLYANQAGNTVLWAPAAGKKFRILACKVSATANIAITGSGVLDIRLNDGASTSIGLSHSIFCPASSVTTIPGAAYDSGWMDLRNGYISSVTDNSLYVNLSATTTAGGVQVIVVGTEE